MITSKDNPKIKRIAALNASSKKRKEEAVFLLEGTRLCGEALREDISNQTHVKNIRKMIKNIDRNICPRCNASLVLRTSKNGKFYGCSNYPKCKFTKKF